MPQHMRGDHLGPIRQVHLEIPASILHRTLLSVLEDTEKPEPGQDTEGLWFISPADVKYSVNPCASHWTVSP